VSAREADDAPPRARAVHAPEADDPLARGRAIRALMIGGSPTAADPPADGDPVAELRQLTLEHVWSALWARPGLALRDRALVTLALLAALGHHAELENLARHVLAEGLLTREELTELAIQSAGYVGFPAAKHAMAAIARATADGA
jgi:alkylhydroperoxidase/carboxymuconolactone decarboxylase family protein YurZ